MYATQITKKLVFIWKTSMSIILPIIDVDLIIALSLEALVHNNITLLLEHIVYIYYLICFGKNQVEIQAIINFGNKINSMTLVYIKKLGF